MTEFEKIVSNRKPIKNSYVVTKNIYAGEYPGDKYGEKAEVKIRQMHVFGVRHFIDLTEEGELVPYAHLLPADCTYTRFPIRDVDIPHNVKDVRALILRIQELPKRGDGYVYIHCWGGVGRTGTIVGCLLAEMYQLDYIATMAKLEHLFSACPKSAYRQTPETKEQREFIARFIMEQNREYTPERITELNPNEINWINIWNSNI